jgi:hypothetical protein
VAASLLENRRAIPSKWKDAFFEELRSDNKAYADHARRTMERLGVKFTDGTYMRLIATVIAGAIIALSASALG